MNHHSDSNSERDVKDVCDMNSDPNKLLNQLEQATSAGFVDPSKLDEETAMLRESWVSLGRVLQAAEGPPPAIRFSTQKISFADQSTSLEKKSEVSRSSRFRRIGAVLAIGLSLAGIWLCMQMGLLNQNPAPHPHPAELVETGRPEPEKFERDPVSSLPVNVAPETVAPLAWDDGWDNQVALTASAIEQLRAEQNTRDDSISRLQNMFLEYSQEFESSSL